MPGGNMIFDEKNVIGFFNGLTETGLEFGAEITIGYNSVHQELPMLGQFVFIELSRPDEAVLGRITTIRSSGKLATGPGDELGLKNVEHGTPMSEDIRAQFLRYKISLRLLGILREDRKGNIQIVASNRRLPHLGAKVAFLSDTLLRRVAGADRGGSEIGYFALGEFIYCLGDEASHSIPDEFIQLSPIVKPQFHVTDLVRRRTQIFARAGYGKSNLIKLLFAALYKNNIPTITLDDGTDHPVGSLLFDPDGEYFWPGAQGGAPPGLCDIPDLANRIVLFTDRHSDHPYYQSFVAGTPRIDLRQLSPAVAIRVGIPTDRQGQQGTEYIGRMRKGENWNELIDRTWLYLQNSQWELIDDSHLQRLTNVQANSTGGLRNSLLMMVRDLHDPRSSTLDKTLKALRNGAIVIFDLSRMRGRPATSINALMLQQVFNHNLESHTDGDIIPCISIIEEAQKVLSGTSSGDAHPVFVEWTKEGRKYGLGSVIVTQQPGVIDMEILSQSDTTFAFHVISKSDLRALQQANAQFSDDILAALLNEPIEGQGYFWSSASKPKLSYPISFRAFDFGQIYKRLDQNKLSRSPITQSSELSKNYPDHKLPNNSLFEESEEDMLNMEYVPPSDAHKKHAEQHAASLNQYFPITSKGKPLFAIKNDLKSIVGYNSTQKIVTKGRLWAAIEKYHGQRESGGWRVEKRLTKDNRHYLMIIPVGV